jgi:hypothetical protein
MSLDQCKTLVEDYNTLFINPYYYNVKGWLEYSKVINIAPIVEDFIIAKLSLEKFVDYAFINDTRYQECFHNPDGPGGNRALLKWMCIYLLEKEFSVVCFADSAYEFLYQKLLARSNFVNE